MGRWLRGVCREVCYGVDRRVEREKIGGADFLLV